MSEPIKISDASHSVKGKTTSSNGDTLLVDQSLGLYIVCDGVSGHKDPTLASRTCAQTILEQIKANGSSAKTHQERGQVLEAAVAESSKAVFKKGAPSGEGEPGRLATTVVALWIKDGLGVLAHVGDSRAYLVRKGKAQKITEDHSVAAEMIKKGQWTIEQAKKSPFAHTLTRAVGMEAWIPVDVLQVEFAPGDRMVLCTDGIHDAISESGIAEALKSAGTNDPAKALVEKAFTTLGRDDTTAVVLSFDAPPKKENTPPAMDLNAGDRLDLLGKADLFRYLNTAELLKVMSLTKKLDVPMGAVLIQEGTPGQDMYIVLRGKLEVLKSDTPVATRGPGLMVGDMAMIEGGKRFATVRATEPTSLLRILRDPLFALMQREPGIAVKLLWALCKSQNDRLKQTTKDLVEEKADQPEGPFTA